MIKIISGNLTKYEMYQLVKNKNIIKKNQLKGWFDDYPYIEKIDDKEYIFYYPSTWINQTEIVQAVELIMKELHKTNEYNIIIIDDDSMLIEAIEVFSYEYDVNIEFYMVTKCNFVIKIKELKRGNMYPLYTILGKGFQKINEIRFNNEVLKYE